MHHQQQSMIVGSRPTCLGLLVGLLAGALPAPGLFSICEEEKKSALIFDNKGFHETVWLGVCLLITNHKKINNPRKQHHKSQNQINQKIIRKNFREAH